MTNSLRQMKWMPLLAVCLGSFMLLVDVTVVNVALPDMAVDLGASFAALQWVVDVYAIALAALLLGAGALADARGHRGVYVGGLVLFAVSSLCSGLAPSTAALIVARAFQGAGAAAMFATTISLVNAAYEGRDRGLAFGVWGAVNGAAAAAGPIVGGLLTQGLSWRWIFFLNLPVSAAALALSLVVLPRAAERRAARIDLPGIAAFTTSVAALTYALTRAPAAGWTTTPTLALFGLALLAAVAFIAIELRRAHPLIDLALLRRPAFSGTMIAALALSFAAFGSAPYLSLWLQAVNGMSPIGAGLALAPLSLAVLVSALGLGRVLHRTPPRLPIGVGLALVGAGTLLQAHLGAGSDWTDLVPGEIVVGLGVGLVAPTLAAAALGAVPAGRSGMAAGSVNTMRQLGFALGIAALGAIVEAHAGARPDADATSHATFAAALDPALVVAGIVGLAGAGLSLALLRDRRGPAAAKASPSAPAHPRTALGRSEGQVSPRPRRWSGAGR
jgi:EmrB/QacA subfamily drug resistance transporter